LPSKLPASIEGKVLLDADRVEIVGPYGMTRWFLSIDGTNSPQMACKIWLELSERKTLGLNSFFCTKTGEQFGIDGFEYSRKFCEGIIRV